MAQAPGLGIAALTRGFAQLSISQKLGFLVALAALAAVVIVALLWVRTTEYRVLYSNLSDRDGGEVIAALAQLNVPYRVAEGGSVLLVPAAQVYDLRLKLAAQGLPKGGAVGFELMDGQKFGISQFAEQVNYQRALAGELARTVQSVAAVQTARVHLAIPRQSVFVRDAPQPSASVFVSTHPGRRLDPGQVAAIQHLVASSVPELSAINVTLVDQNGNLLSGVPSESGTDRLEPAQLKYLQAVETGYAARIENILKPLLGADNVRAQVTAALDFDRVEETSETFKPNQAPQQATLRTQHTVETLSPGAQGLDSVPGARPNHQPAAADSAPPVASAATAPRPRIAAAPTGSHRENVVQYEVDKTVRHVRGEVGAVRRLSAAVVVNYRRDPLTAGSVAPRPLSEEELRHVTALAREAMGFDPARGDTLNVVNAPFSSELVAAEVVVPSAWTAWVEDVTSPNGAMRLLKYLIVAVAVLSALLLARTALRALLRTARPAPGLPLETQAGPLPDVSAARSAAPGYEADLRAVRELARQEPRIVANVVKEWVSGR